MTEKEQADVVLSRKAVFVRCCLKLMADNNVIEDISDNYIFVKHLFEQIIEEHLYPDHLFDVVEDFLIEYDPKKFPISKAHKYPYIA